MDDEPDVLSIGAEYGGASVIDDRPLVSYILVASPDERVAAAACRHAGRVWWLPAPAGHRHVLAYMGRSGFRHFGEEVQGYVTAGGRFVDQREARTIARGVAVIDDVL